MSKRNTLTDEQMTVLKEQFDACAGNQDCVTFDQVVHILRINGQNPTQHDIDDLNEACGDDGPLVFAEYITIMEMTVKPYKDVKNNLKKALESLDTNGDGQISVEELTNNCGVEKKLAQKIIHEFDENKDINYKEFCDYLLDETWLVEQYGKDYKA